MFVFVTSRCKFIDSNEFHFNTKKLRNKYQKTSSRFKAIKVKKQYSFNFISMYVFGAKYIINTWKMKNLIPLTLQNVFPIRFSPSR